LVPSWPSVGCLRPTNVLQRTRATIDLTLGRAPAYSRRLAPAFGGRLRRGIIPLCYASRVARAAEHGPLGPAAAPCALVLSSCARASPEGQYERQRVT